MFEFTGQRIDHRVDLVEQILDAVPIELSLRGRSNSYTLVVLDFDAANTWQAILIVMYADRDRAVRLLIPWPACGPIG
jgi:hypothetical protein